MNRAKFWSLPLLGIWGMLSFGLIFAQENSVYLSNYKGILSKAEALLIEEVLVQHAQLTGEKLEVAIVSDAAEWDVFYQKWLQGGEKVEPSRVLFLLQPQASRVQIWASEGLEDVFTADKRALVIERWINPEVEAGQWNQVLTAGVVGILKELKSPVFLRADLEEKWKSVLNKNLPLPPPQSEFGMGAVFVLLGVPFLILGLVWISITGGRVTYSESGLYSVRGLNWLKQEWKSKKTHPESETAGDGVVWVEAIKKASASKAGKIELVLSPRYFEKNAEAYARKLYLMDEHRALQVGGTILIYFNPRYTNFAVIAHPLYAEVLNPVMKEALLSTCPERALLYVIERAGALLPSAAVTRV